MSDIVERLRELEAVESELACECDCPPEATANYRYAMTCAEAADLITSLRAEVEQHQKSFDVRWDATMRAIKRWQEAHPGNDLNWPDHADLVVWLLERDAALRAENKKRRAALWGIHAVCNNWDWFVWRLPIRRIKRIASAALRE